MILTSQFSYSVESSATSINGSWHNVSLLYFLDTNYTIKNVITCNAQFTYMIKFMYSCLLIHHLQVSYECKKDKILVSLKAQLVIERCTGTAEDMSLNPRQD